MITNATSSACPLCKSDKVTLLKTIPADRLASDWGRTFGMDIRDELHGNAEIHLYQCNQSSLRFFVPNTIAGSGELYGNLEKFDWYYPKRKWEHDVALRDIQGCQRILEIGCGQGGFLLLAREKLRADVEGIELNQQAAQAAREKSLKVHLEQLDAFADAHENSFDAVCAFQVLEHVPDPKQFLESASKLVRPGGRLVVCVPNQDSFLQHQWNILDMPPHHMTQWSRRALEQLQLLFPLKLKLVRLEPLASYHCRPFVSAWANHYRQRSLMGAIVWNKLTRWFAYGLLRIGLRRFLRGQSIYAVYERIA